MTSSRRKIGFLLSGITVFTAASAVAYAQESASFTVAYRITDIGEHERYRRRDSDVRLNISGTGALNTFNQRTTDLREIQRLQQLEEIKRRSFQNDRDIAPRATLPPRNIVDNAKTKGKSRKSGSIIDDPRLHLQELRENTRVNRLQNLKSGDISGPCAGLSGGRLVQCRYRQE